MASNRVLVLTLAMLVFGQMALGQNSISFSFTIPGTSDTRTSAAVLDSNGIMVKTLWGNVNYPPGTYTATWDGSYDVAATSTPGSSYTIKLLINNVTYAYDGHFFATELDWYGTHKYSQVCGWTAGLPKITFAGNRGWVACSYNEISNNIMVFDRNTPNYPYQPNESYKQAQGNIFHETDDIATDNQWVYLLEHSAGSNTPPGDKNYILAVDANSSMPVFFSQGTLDLGTGIWFNPPLTSSYIDQTPNSANNGQTGIAVQRSGNILAVAHARTGVINLFDKKTGGSLGTVTGVAVPTLNPLITNMAFTSEGLWYTADGQLYLITGLPSSPVITQPITGFQYVAAIGANTKTNVLYVADGGTNQQIYGYAAGTHAKVRTYGTLGGYNDCNPSITHDRLLLDETATVGTSIVSGFKYYVFVSADDDDNLWIGDMSGRRVQHISPSNTYVEQILYKRPSYIITASETMPTRVFIEWTEYALDYTKTNVPGDGDPAVGGSGAWVLSKNWRVCALGAHGSPPLAVPGQDTYYWLAVERLSNGKVYAYPTYHPGTGQPRIMYQLPEDGTPARNTGVTVQAGWLMQRNGDLTSYSTTGTAPNKSINIVKQQLTGFDANSNPIYGASTTVASTTTNASNQLLTASGGSLGGYVLGYDDPSSGGYYAVFNAAPLGVNNNYPHAAGFKIGSPSYLWMTMPEICMTVSDLKGHFPCATSSGAGGTSAINVIHSEGTNFLYMYAGNYSPFGAQFYHYYEDGMMIGQFGNTQGFPRFGTNDPIPPGTFGNANGFQTTTVNGDIYVYNGDEAYAPAHRWHISNLNTIHEYSGTTTLQPNGSVSLTKVF